MAPFVTPFVAPFVTPFVTPFPILGKTLKIDSMRIADETKREEKQYTVMISSSVYGFEDQLDRIAAIFRTLGYHVVMSKEGSLPVNPRLGNFENCLKAVEDCDLFFGIIRPNCGTGTSNNKSITFQEFERARELQKPSWFVIDNKVKWYKDLIRCLRMRMNPKTPHEDLNTFLKDFIKTTQDNKKKLPRVMDIFEPDESRTFDPECLTMERFVNQQGVPRDEVTNNWMQYYNSLTDIEMYISTNFGDRNFIDNILK